MRLLKSLTVLLLVATAVLATVGPAYAATVDFVQPGSQPATDGTTVVWVNQGIYAARFPDPQPFLVAATPANTYVYPDVSGDYVIWEQDCAGSNCPVAPVNILAKNLASGQQFDVASGSRPHISGTRVLYISGSHLMLRDLATMADPVIVATTPDGWSIQDARISGDRIAWDEYQIVDRVYHVRIKTTRLGQDTVTVTEGIGMPYFGIDLAGDTLVYVGVTNQLTAVNLVTGQGCTQKVGDEARGCWQKRRWP